MALLAYYLFMKFEMKIEIFLENSLSLGWVFGVRYLGSTKNAFFLGTYLGIWSWTARRIKNLILVVQFSFSSVNRFLICLK